jgi:hypothetical protein
VVRDVSVALFFGQHGASASGGGADAAVRGRRGAARGATLFVRRRSQGRTAVWLLAGTLVGTLLLHAALRLVDIWIFEQRYLTGLTLCAVLLAGGVDSLRWRAAVPVAALVLVAAGRPS